MESLSYYQKNKLALSARKKLKYHSDPVYREKCLAYRKAHQSEVSKRQRQQRRYKLAFNGRVYNTLPMNNIVSLLGRSYNCLHDLEKKGLIPGCIFPIKQRRYTMKQAELIGEIAEAMWKLGAKRIRHKKLQEFLQVHKFKMYKHWYDEYVKQ